MQLPSEAAEGGQHAEGRPGSGDGAGEACRDAVRTRNLVGSSHTFLQQERDNVRCGSCPEAPGALPGPGAVGRVKPEQDVVFGYEDV